MKALESTHILSRILKSRRKRVSESKQRVPEAVVRKMASMAPAPPSFRNALESSERPRIIAEVKKASPSAGVLIDELDVTALARSYAEAGAAAISVVTEEDHFQGNLGWVREAQVSSGLPVLRKDFVFDPYQVHETRASGASAILLIVAMLECKALQDLIGVATETGLDALVEVHDAGELDEAVRAGATLIGVNNRDLKTFEVRLETSVELGSRMPDGVLFIAESGIHTREDRVRLEEAGADAFLIGERLLRSSDPGTALRELL